MDRRTFVKSGVGSLAVGAVNPMEFGDIIAPNWRNVSSEEMHDFFGKFDSAMLKTETNKIHGLYIKDLLSKPGAIFDEKLFRGSLRSLLLAGNFGDLSVEAQVHPGVQMRLRYSAPEVDETVEGVIDKLRSVTQDEYKHVKSSLNADPELGDRLIEALDLEAAAVGTHSKRRKKLRKIGKRVVKRLKQSPEKFINDSLKKCDKLLEKFSTEEKMQKFIEAKIGKDAFKKRVKAAEKAALRWKEMEEKSGIPTYNPNILLKERGKTLSLKDEDKKKKKGLKLLGIAGIITAAGLLLMAIGGESFIFWVGVVAGVTVGPILIIVALIILIINAT